MDSTPPRRIRAALRQLLAPDIGVLVEDAVLIVDELVTNALVHGGSPRRCRLSMRADPPMLRVEVDDSGEEAPRLRTADSTGGRGIALLDQLAIAWGVRRSGGFKTVWAELPLDRPRYPVAGLESRP